VLLGVSWYSFNQAYRNQLLLSPLFTTATIIARPSSFTVTYRYFVAALSQTFEETVSDRSMPGPGIAFQPGMTLDVMYAAADPSVSQAIDPEDFRYSPIHQVVLNTYFGLFFGLFGLIFLLGVLPHDIATYLKVKLPTPTWYGQILLGFAFGGLLSFLLWIVGWPMPQLMWKLMGENVIATAVVVTLLGILLAFMVNARRNPERASLIKVPRLSRRRKQKRR
jgi:hypothetical protein